jgi:hypothetical protein
MRRIIGIWIAALLPAVPALSKQAIVQGKASRYALYISALPQPYVQGDLRTLGGAGGVLFTAFEGGFYRSSDQGRTWESSPLPASQEELYGNVAIQPRGTELWMTFLDRPSAGASKSTALYASADQGRTWISHGLPTPMLKGVMAREDTVIAYGTGGCWALAPGAAGFAAWSRGLGKTDSGRGTVTFEATVTSEAIVTSEATVTAVTAGNKYVFATVHLPAENRVAIFRSAGFGQAWEEAGNGLPNADWRIAAVDDAVYAMAPERGIYATGADIPSWSRLIAHFGDLDGAFFFRGKGYLGLMTSDSVFKRDGASWRWASQGYHGKKMRVERMFADSGAMMGLVEGEAMISTDGGVLWRAAGMGRNFRESGRNPLLSVAEWGGRRFLQYDKRTYWTADGGKTWKSHGWMAAVKPEKGPENILPDARFKSTGRDLYLDGGSGTRTLAAYNPAKDEWEPVDLIGDAAFNSIAAVACDTGRLYKATFDGRVSVSGDRGNTWVSAAVPPESLLAGQGPFDALRAEGERLVLGYKSRRLASELATVDGGKTWVKYPAYANVHPLSGCLHWVENGNLISDCAPDGRRDSVPVAFLTLSRLFRQEGGGVFALTDAGLVHYVPVPAPAWEVVPGPDPDGWKGWLYSGDVLAHQTSEQIRWIAGVEPIASGIRERPGPRASRPARPGLGLPPWLEAGVRPDGRAVPRRESSPPVPKAALSR